MHEVTSLMGREFLRFFFLRLFFRFFRQLFSRFRFLFRFFFRLFGRFLNRIVRGFSVQILQRNPCRYNHQILGELRCFILGFFRRLFGRCHRTDRFVYRFICRFFRFVCRIGLIFGDVFIFRQIFIFGKIGVILIGSILVFVRKVPVIIRRFFRCGTEKCFGLDNLNLFIHNDGKFSITFQQFFGFRRFSQGNSAGKQHNQGKNKCQNTFCFHMFGFLLSLFHTHNQQPALYAAKAAVAGDQGNNVISFGYLNTGIVKGFLPGTVYELQEGIVILEGSC